MRFRQAPQDLLTNPGVNGILPALRTFPSNEVAVIGCHSASFARASCEYDLLVVSKDTMPEKFVKVKQSYAELLFRDESWIRHPDPELGLALSRAVPLRDNSLLLASAIAECRRTYEQNCRKRLEVHLASALKALGRVDELVAKGATTEADFWLLGAAVEYAQAELLFGGVIPSPSHTLAQMKSLPRRRPAIFKPWVDGSGLELASRDSCENRLDALAILYDVLRNSGVRGDMSAQLGRYLDPGAISVLRMKTAELLDSMHSVECYCFLGQEAVRTVLDLYLLHAERIAKTKDYSAVIRELTVGQHRLISAEVVRALGFTRTLEMLKDAGTSMKASVAQLTRRI